MGCQSSDRRAAQTAPEFGKRLDASRRGAATIFATVPISPEVTSRGVAVNVDTAQAFTYGHARRVNRRMDRRDFRQTRRAVRRGVY